MLVLTAAALFGLLLTSTGLGLAVHHATAHSHESSSTHPQGRSPLDYDPGCSTCQHLKTSDRIAICEPVVLLVLIDSSWPALSAQVAGVAQCTFFADRARAPPTS